VGNLGERVGQIENKVQQVWGILDNQNQEIRKQVNDEKDQWMN